VLQTQVDAPCNKLATVDVPWRKAEHRLSSEFGTTVSEEVPLLLDIGPTRIPLKQSIG